MKKLYASLWIVLALLIVVTPVPALAWSHGSPQIDLGDGWTCFTTLNCGAATTANFGATCDGVTPDDDAVTSMATYAVAHNPVVMKLYIPPGSTCAAPTNHNLTYCCGNGDIFTGTPIKNMIIWAYKATFAEISIGGSSFVAPFPPTPANQNALIASVSAGATSVVVTDGNVGRFAATDRIMVMGDCLQTSGYPPNMQFYDSVQITGIVGNTVSFTPPLTNSYKSNWPICDLPNIGNQGGPASIFKRAPTWDTNVTIYGLTVPNQLSQVNLIAREVSLVDVNIHGNGGISPSGNDHFHAQNSQFNGAEIDKTIGNLRIVRSFPSDFPSFQSPSPHNGTIEFSTIYCAISGTSTNFSVLYTTVLDAGCGGVISAGPNFYGNGQALNIANSTFPGAGSNQHEMLVSDFTYSAGTFTMPKAIDSHEIDLWFLQWTPGFRFKFGFHNSFSSTCTPNFTFRVDDLSEDGSGYYFPTSSWEQDGVPIATPSVMPTPTCPGGINMLVSYPAQTITQTNTGSSPDLTHFGAN